jgi:uncharacterized damage-inducible protein DinB
MQRATATDMSLMQYFRRQFCYDAWANGEAFSAIKAASNPLNIDRPLKVLAHILSAERLWLERLRQQTQSTPVWPESGVTQSEAQMAEVHRLWRDFLFELPDAQLSQSANYKNSKGEPWSSTVQDILTHVLLHSAYHRGQIAILLREAGANPAYTDFIHAVRQGFIE